jgi:hypothetical protein
VAPIAGRSDIRPLLDFLHFSLEFFYFELNLFRPYFIIFFLIFVFSLHIAQLVGFVLQLFYPFFRGQ